LLDVSEDWLRWGAAYIDTAADGASVHRVESAAATYTRAEEVKSLTQDIMLLSPKDREYLRAILNVMLRHSREGK
jgi:hypothetical protein